MLQEQKEACLRQAEAISSQIHADQRQLAILHNATAPVARLPHDLLALVFNLVCASNPSAIHKQPEVLLSHACAAWRHAALSTPSLWTTIRFPVTIRRRDALQAYLDRANGALLHLHLGPYPHEPTLRTFYQITRDMVMPHLTHTRSLVLSGLNVDHLASLLLIANNFDMPLLTCLSLSASSPATNHVNPIPVLPRGAPHLVDIRADTIPLAFPNPPPALRTLQLRANSSLRPVSLSNFHATLGACANSLTTLIVAGTVVPTSAALPDSAVNLPSLTKLEVHAPAALSVLRFLRTPALETLVLVKFKSLPTATSAASSQPGLWSPTFAAMTPTTPTFSPLRTPAVSPGALTGAGGVQAGWPNLRTLRCVRCIFDAASMDVYALRAMAGLKEVSLSYDPNALAPRHAHGTIGAIGGGAVPNAYVGHSALLRLLLNADKQALFMGSTPLLPDLERLVLVDTRHLHYPSSSFNGPVAGGMDIDDEDFDDDEDDEEDEDGGRNGVQGAESILSQDIRLLASFSLHRIALGRPLSRVRFEGPRARQLERKFERAVWRAVVDGEVGAGAEGLSPFGPAAASGVSAASGGTGSEDEGLGWRVPTEVDTPMRPFSTRANVDGPADGVEGPDWADVADAYTAKFTEFTFRMMQQRKQQQQQQQASGQAPAAG